MGEWSEYFEQFPEENPANQKQELDLGPMSSFFPHLHLSQLTKAELAIENAKIEELNAQAERLAKEKADFIENAKSKPIYREDSCPICRIKAMSIYKVSDNSFYCECQNCNVSGDGSDIPKIFEKIENDIWNSEM
jgi:hypothetical protein